MWMRINVKDNALSCGSESKPQIERTSVSFVVFLRKTRTAYDWAPNAHRTIRFEKLHEEEKHWGCTIWEPRRWLLYIFSQKIKPLHSCSSVDWDLRSEELPICPTTPLPNHQSNTVLSHSSYLFKNAIKLCHYNQFFGFLFDLCLQIGCIFGVDTFINGEATAFY